MIEWVETAKWKIEGFVKDEARYTITRFGASYDLHYVERTPRVKRTKAKVVLTPLGSKKVYTDQEKDDTIKEYKMICAEHFTKIRNDKIGNILR